MKSFGRILKAVEKAKLKIAPYYISYARQYTGN